MVVEEEEEGKKETYIAMCVLTLNSKTDIEPYFDLTENQEV